MSGKPLENARPADVVASALKPICCKHFALPISHGFGRTKQPDSCNVRKVSGVRDLTDCICSFESKDGSIKQLHEVRQDEEYDLIVTQSAGLIRYRLNDTIKVTGKYKNTPLLSFVGRSGAVCDMVGEKLQGEFVCGAIKEIVPSGNFTVVPVLQNSCTSSAVNSSVPRSHYVVLTDSRQYGLESKAETVLSRAWHYRQARLAGQLGPAQVSRVPAFQQTIQRFYESEGIKSGDIKCTPLITDVRTAARLLNYVEARTGSGLTQRH